MALSLLPSLGVMDYVNADAIALGLSPLNPGSMALPAGRLMLKRLHALAESGKNFAFETTLAARTFVPFLQDCKDKRYTINLVYFWLRSPGLALERVARRVASGGHSIPEDVIFRRYLRGWQNLLKLYLPLCDSWIILDNSDSNLQRVAQGARDGQAIIYDIEKWEQIKRGNDD